MRSLVVLLIASGLFAALFAPAAPVEASSCQFDFGFRTLRDLMPTVVGSCLEPERYNATGDGLQKTTGGLLVWRKADNQTAFTDGTRTWILGPTGLEERPSQDRYPGEQGSCASAPRVTTSPWSTADDGSRTAHGRVANDCNDPVGVIIDFIAADPATGQPSADGPSVYLSLAPGQSVSFVENVPSAGSDATIQSRVTWFDASSSAYCFRVDAGHCLTMDPWLSSSAASLASVPGGRWLLRVAAENDVSVISGSLPDGDVGRYISQPGRLIVLSRDLLQESSWVRAATLGHELQHAADDAAGLLSDHPTADQCFSQEARAFSREAQVWNNLWHGHLPPNLDARHLALNSYAGVLAEDWRDGGLIIARQVDTGCAGPTTVGSALP